MPAPPEVAKARAELLKFALAYPESLEGLAVGRAGGEGEDQGVPVPRQGRGRLSLSVKLPTSASLALGLPFAEPTGYGLGKSGWVTASFTPKARLPLGMLKQWIDESYRAVAPKTLVKRLDAGPPATAKAAARSQRPK